MNKAATVWIWHMKYVQRHFASFKLPRAQDEFHFVFRGALLVHANANNGDDVIIQTVISVQNNIQSQTS